MKPTLDDRLALLEAFSTSVSDSDSGWWPFTFLRPAQHERLDTVRCLLFCVLQGLPLALAALLFGRLVGDGVRTLHVVAFPLCVCAAYLVVFRSTFAFFWNRRAARLRPLVERRARWRRDRTDPPA